MVHLADFSRTEQAARAAGLEIYGAVHPAREASSGLAAGTLVLLGTAGEFWPRFKASPEYCDGTPDPIDRWSERVISALAEQLHAVPHFPFGGPPYAPFVTWALQSGRAFTSPSQMLVHDQAGMLISLRGALHFEQEFTIPAPALQASPCQSCTDRPCLTTCPTGAMVDGGPYGLAACHRHLDTSAGSDCLKRGCIARRSCPLSAGAERPFEQTAHHMRYFHAQ